MNRIIGAITIFTALSLAVVSLIVVFTLFTVSEKVVMPSYSTSMATAHNVSAASWLVFDVKTGEVLYSYRADEPRPIASVTKLPVARLLFESSHIWATTTITWSDVNTEGAAGHLYFGEEYRLHTLLFPLLLESSNDASAVFEREFSSLIAGLNRYVTLLGLTHTHFSDASGLSAENVSTASELARIFTEIYTSSRHVVDITGLQQYLSINNGWLNNNPFASDPRFIGGKQGYTPEAGKTLVAAFREPLNNQVEREIGYVILGSEDLRFDMSILRNHVQNNVSYSGGWSQKLTKRSE